MKELILLQQECLNRLLNYQGCSGQCPIGKFCIQSGCSDGDCSRCLNQIQHGQPNFSYRCEKITYQYVLRFFNRFASEICYAMRSYNYNDTRRANVVSLGCGPGSEVFGIIKAFQSIKLDAKLYYEGHDLLDVWEPVQKLCKDNLSQYPHEINFYTSNLFADFHGFDNNVVHILMLNYLLSHAAKFYSNQVKNQFIDEIVDFVICNNVRNILFNDINYYGDYNLLNSGTQLVRLMVEKLLQKGKQLSVQGCYFPGDPLHGWIRWSPYNSNSLLFNKLQGNTYMKNVGYCNSKQIFIHIK